MAVSVIGSVTRVCLKPARYSVVTRALKPISEPGYKSMSSSTLSRTLACRRFARSSPVRPAVCNYSQASTKGDQELADFLVEEIEAEKKARKSTQIPKIEGFDVKTEGSEVTLTRSFNKETITVRLNVNHSVDAEDAADEFTARQDNAPEPGEMKSKPNFTVEIERGGKKLYFSCTFNEGAEPEGQSDNYADSFGVAEFAIYEGEWTDEVYTVSGDIMDGYLYDLLMNMLEERGISSEFGYNLVNFCTIYEHSLYIGLLEKLKDFVSKK
ncbi:complement component 1 Q subcomponent-binding protein, mitochondrial [Dermacentor albipictus]|uniref:complement component 1 Q subcomponent-binding protein, mitochondrial n=1 Tax=Dermacentor albipictus TaxID=60249 RepID=UPI0031FE2E09